MPHPKQVLLQRADESIGAAIAFRRTDEGGRTFDAQERNHLLEVRRHVLRSVVMADTKALGDVPGERSEVPAHALADRFQCLEPGRPRTGVDAHASGGEMIDRDEHGGLAVTGERSRQIGAPHRVPGIGNDGAVVVPRPAWGANTPVARRLSCRISRSTRRNDVRMPATRNRAQTLR